jgi:hypothetical protein
MPALAVNPVRVIAVSTSSWTHSGASALTLAMAYDMEQC